MVTKISHKLILTVGGVTIGILLVYSTVLVRSQRQALVSQVTHHAHQLSEMIKGSTKYDMLLNRREDVHRIIEAISEQEGIEDVRIFNKEGTVIYSPAKSLVGAMVDKHAEACYGCHTEDRPLERLPISERTRIYRAEDNTRRLGVINPIYNELSCWTAECHAHEKEQAVLGVLDVSMSLSDVDQVIASDQMKMVVFTVSTIVAISAILWALLHQLVGRPVHRLVEATEAVAGGDLNYQLGVRGDDELSYLGRSFNEMTRKLAEAQTQLYHQDRLASLGRLAAGIAHEINNPLTGVLTYSSFLLKRSQNDAEAREDLEVIVRETKRCREIVKGLLDFSRQVPSRTTPVDMNEVVEQSLHIVANQLSFNHITVHKDLQASLPPVRADAGQLQQVLVNLFVNACDAMVEKGGELEIRTERRDLDDRSEIEVRITDTGCGIPRENVSKVFDPFFSTKAHKGTGLGLAVVWGIIDKHGGTIAVDSELGSGTRFVLRLPAGETASPVKEPTHERR